MPRMRGGKRRIEVISRHDIRKLRGFAALPLLVSGLGLAGCMSGPTYGTGKGAHEQLLEDVTGILDVGPKQSEAIEYKPRPELVRPASTAQLPPPQDSIATASNPAWPESPEQRRKRIRDRATANRDEAGFVPEVAPPTVSAANDDRMHSAGGRGGFQGGGNDMSTMSAGKQREEFNRRLAVSKQGSPTTRRYLSEPPLAYRQPVGTAPVDDVGEDEWKKEQRLKREARKKSGRKTSWADILPW